MRILFLTTLLFTSLALNAQDKALQKKQITLDLKPDFNSELKQQDKTVKNSFLHARDTQVDEKNIFDKSNPPKHKFTVGVGAYAGKAATQDGIKPISINPVIPKMNTFFEN